MFIVDFSIMTTRFSLHDFPFGYDAPTRLPLGPMWASVAVIIRADLIGVGKKVGEMRW